jgi:hypothetical protein
MEEESPREELLSKTSELTLDVLTSDSLGNDNDVGMIEVIPISLDVGEDDVETLPGCEMPSVEDTKDALLALDSLDNDDDVDDVGTVEVNSMSLDDNEDEEILAGCELLSVEDRDDAPLELGDWLADVVAWTDVLRLELEETIELTSVEDETGPNDELIELEVKVGITTCVLEIVVADEPTWELELPLVVPRTELEVDTKRVLPCVEETWLETGDDTAVLVDDVTEVGKEAELSVEQPMAEVEEIAVEDAMEEISPPGLYFPRRTKKIKFGLAVAFPKTTELLWRQELSLVS